MAWINYGLRMIMIVDMGIEKHILNKRKHDVCIIMTMTTSKQREISKCIFFLKNKWWILWRIIPDKCLLISFYHHHHHHYFWYLLWNIYTNGWFKWQTCSFFFFYCQKNKQNWSDCQLRDTVNITHSCGIFFRVISTSNEEDDL
jgi:hypothetical protein